MPSVRVSVIVPFYNVESFVERCIRSLMQQTLKEAEFILVDDASPDSSRSIIERVTKEYDRDVRILSHSINKGLPAARNTGLAEASGEFIYHCDSDDYLEPTMLEEMYDTAIRECADFVYSDFYLDFGASRRVMTNPTFDEPEKMIKEGFLAGLMKYNVWNKLVKRTIYIQSGLLFPDGHAMGEDMTMILLATHATRTAHVAKPLYHYLKTNGNAYSNTFSQKHLDDIKFNANRTFAVLENWAVTDKERYIGFFKLNLKLPFLFSAERSQLSLWKQWYPEANHFISQNTHQPHRTRLVQKWADKGLLPLVRLYRFLINNIYYGILYRQ
ncbi:MAG: glycosyltransferase family 2 protein [Bacteroidales bacterium]|nr:glycosyltransferase family 2 protein [Bacteroidales bacterium]